MTDEFQVESNSSPPQEDSPRQIVIKAKTIIIFLVVNVVILILLGLPYLASWFGLSIPSPWTLPEEPQATGTAENALVIVVKTPTPSPIPSNTPTSPSPETLNGFWEQGIIILSIQEGLDSHLFAYQPLVEVNGNFLPLTRLTGGSWDDITPALSPNKSQLAFASDRGGQWDIYLLDLFRGRTTQFTDTKDYEASPSWSPDGLWLAYEGFIEDNLEIIISPVDGNQDPIQLTDNNAADHKPAWSPSGREIAFVSSRSGSNQVWLANLDETGEDRFVNISGSLLATSSHPVWSPDGRFLAWGAVTSDGLHNIYVWDRENPDALPREKGSGDWAVWSPDGQALLTVVQTAYQTYLTAFTGDENGFVVLPPIQLPGKVFGMLWTEVEFSDSVVGDDFLTPTPLWEVNIGLDIEGVGGRWDLIQLKDVTAPYPRLHDRVDESFEALRIKLSSLVGWDLLADLENAYTPLSSARSPGLVEDWLYTGRAFSVNPLPINAGWMVVVREDFGQRTYWRLFLRARFQDGSQGKPIYELPWDFNARYSGRPLPYDQGGEQASVVPGGYWVDMTHIAAVYGWQRLPALSTWRSAYPSARFNEFVKTDGLDWVSAMLEIYPVEVLLTLTPLPTPTDSPTQVQFWTNSPTPTPTTTFTPTSTSTGTEVTSPTNSHTPTTTITVSPTPLQSTPGTITPTP